jgi:hypothetical protein
LSFGQYAAIRDLAKFPTGGNPRSEMTETTILDTVTMCAFVISSPVVISTRGEILLDRNNYTGHRYNVRFCHFESSCHFDERRNLIGPKQLYWTPSQCALLSFRVQLSFRRKEKSYWTETTILDTVTMCAFVISTPVVISTRGEILLDRNNYTGHRYNVRFCHFESSRP